jgi:hypothetical protein
MLRGEDVDLLLTQLRDMQAGSSGHEAPEEQRLLLARGVKDLRDQALRLYAPPPLF